MCGGLAEYFEMDPTLVRVIFVVLALVQGIGLVAYVILAAVVPNEPGLVTEPALPPPRPGAEEGAPAVRRRNQRLLGIFLIGLGGLLFLSSFQWWTGLLSGLLLGNPLWPLALVVLGIALLLIRL